MPPDLAALYEEFHAGHYLLTDHASKRAAQRLITSNEIAAAVINGEIIEDYPDDKYGPSCLLHGKTESGRSLHIQVSYPPNVKVITIYEPDTNEWDETLKVRKTS